MLDVDRRHCAGAAPRRPGRNCSPPWTAAPTSPASCAVAAWCRVRAWPGWGCPCRGRRWPGTGTSIPRTATTCVRVSPPRWPGTSGRTPSPPGCRSTTLCRLLGLPDRALLAPLVPAPLCAARRPGGHGEPASGGRAAGRRADPAGLRARAVPGTGERPADRPRARAAGDRRRRPLPACSSGSPRMSCCPRTPSRRRLGCWPACRSPSPSARPAEPWTPPGGGGPAAGDPGPPGSHPAAARRLPDARRAVEPARRRRGSPTVSRYGGRCDLADKNHRWRIEAYRAPDLQVRRLRHERAGGVGAALAVRHALAGPGGSCRTPSSWTTLEKA